MNVTDITHGQVTMADMHLEFPEGTAVVDAINGIFYKTDASDNAIESTIEPLYDVDPSQVKMPPPPKEKYTIINYILMTIGIVMILWALYTMIQKRRNDS
jgi:hypothetical protein